ncbi:peptidylprolyl isomerase [Geothrix sp. PMB-07]|uniref:peptidylprolyl isomerase n=1 Tax=Geothrix sp. PMB-07 TaxID=3068640 RepID=UPI002741F43B|nr:peptidylprolyl isomerase [Geothrix sp. PMB-07]WLT33233.1 peptidylprolyl isomerase [Geothrix sp. PMB-07]
MRPLLSLLPLSLLAPQAAFAQAGPQTQLPHFTVREAIQAEWSRQPLAFIETQKAALSPADRALLERAQQRIGAPGTSPLLPPELEKPTLEVWEVKAQTARTPQDRFTALFFLNRLKSSKALSPLNGLGPADASAWPRHLHLEAAIASARLNGAEVSPSLQAFLDALQKTGKVDPVRAQAARLRLVMAGKEKDLLPPVKATPGSLLALLDAWNRAPWAQRRELALSAFKTLSPDSPIWPRLGVQRPTEAVLNQACVGILSRLSEGVPSPAPAEAFQVQGGPWSCATSPLATWYGYQALAKLETPLPSIQTALAQEPPLGATTPLMLGTLLPALRKQSPTQADRVRAELLAGKDPLGRAAAIDDLPAAPADLAALTQRTWADGQFESQQTLIQSYSRWKLTPDEQKAQLRPWLQHPDWTCRWEAHQALVKLDPATAWPAAPAPTSTHEAILKEATHLAERGQPVRVRITFAGKRSVTLRLDPTVAPMNVANLVLLARAGYFNGRLVPRVVPDFVVQMGSPFDTMDGGPGYNVRCENSLTWYGPGSVGMALSGKDTGGSQFFITTNGTPHLTGKYTRLGEVEDLDQALPLLDDLELGARILTIKVLEP